MTKDGTKGDYMWERLLRKIYTQAQLDGMNQEQFDAAKTAARKRLNILHSEQVTSIDKSTR